jgi:tetratricopeptide (TPR) repeat protein
MTMAKQASRTNERAPAAGSGRRPASRRWPRAVGGLVTALTMAFAVSVAAQPAGGAGRGAAAPAASGRAAVSAGAAPAPSAAPAASVRAAAAPGSTPGAGSAGPASSGAPPASTSAPPSPVPGGGPSPAFHAHAPPLPPPSPEQLAAYEAMRQEADAYAKGARDYKDTITTIITLHYEEKKRAILGGLDREIGIEKEELRKARETAIKRLEDFVAKYSGANAQPEATPDAMYRLAALYEERARSDDDPNADLAVTLKPAIALYKRVIKEFPKYGELAGVYYFLGHALNDSRRVDEAQQVWRSLVCHNHYKYPVPTDPKNPDVDTVAAMPQDHDATFWKVWRSKYARTEQLKKGPKDDTTFQDPYPQDCAMIPQPNALPGTEPKYVAEVWWRMGDWEFDQIDIAGGVLETEPFAVWDYNRAATDYQHAMQYKKPPLYGVALYKYAWTLFKQQRYEAAVREFVHLLNYTDEQEKLTGDPGADFRQEAFTYIAGSLDNFDFAGPPPEEPYITRPDVLDTAKSPAEAEQKLHIAIDRVQDPRLIPQDKKWTIEIYKALALEFRAINQYNNALAVYQMTLDKWPMDPSAPETQNAIAEVYDLLVRQTKVGDQRREYERKVLEARTALAKYIGDTAWVDANKDNPGALQRAEELVRSGLKGAAVTHTRNGQAAVAQAEQTSDAKEQLRLTNYALAEYKLAALGWLGYLKQDENAPDAYKARYFYADALHNEVRLEVVLHKFDARQYPEPSSQEIATAIQAAVAVRDSDEDDQFIDNAGLFAVDLADVDRDLAFQRFKDSSGAQGIEARKEPKLEGAEGQKKVIEDPIPDVIQKSMLARDEYVQRVPPERDKSNNAQTYAQYVADQYYAYGHFKEAKARYQALYEQYCRKKPVGYEAWKGLMNIALKSNDGEGARVLATADQDPNKTCAIAGAATDEQITESKAQDFTKSVIVNARFKDANEAFEAAKAAPAGPAKDALWRKAGKMYEDALRAAPAHKDAPAAAINSAFCYKQVGEFNKAIDLYQLFIANYGSEDILDRLQKGGVDPATKQKAGPDPEQYKERIKYLGMAYDALSTTYYGFFAYQRAAESFAKIATNTRFDDERRAASARIGMVLYSNLGDRSNMTKMYDILVDPKMRLTSDKRAEADYLKASFDYAQWNPTGAETAGNAASRNQAIGSLTQFHTQNKNRPESARFVLESAYRIAKMMQSGGDGGYRNWFKTTIADWESFKTRPAAINLPDGKTGQIAATDAPYSDYGGEADFALVDEEVHAKFDYSTGHHHYQGAVADVVKDVDKDLGEAEKTWRPQLETVATKYNSFQWAAAATARIGTLYDSIRTGLDLVVPKYFTPKQQALLDKLQKIADQLQAAGQQEKADQVQQQIDDTKDAVRTKWRSTKDQYLEVCTQKAVSRYVTAALIARKYNVKDTTVQAGVSRLAFFTDFLGDDKMKVYVENTPDPLNQGAKLTYTSGEFLQWRSGVVTTPPANGQPAPLPAAP